MVATALRMDVGGEGAFTDINSPGMMSTGRIIVMRRSSSETTNFRSDERCEGAEIV